MDKDLVSWLNAQNKDYQTGIAIYKRLHKEQLNLPRYERGATDENKKSLFDDLRLLYYELKGIDLSIKKVVSTPVVAVSAPVEVATAPLPKKENPELLQVCKMEADNAFKKMAQTKAVLFSMCDVEKRPNENTDDIVEARKLLAFDILEQHSEMKRLYAVSEFVKEHGHLPDDGPTEMEPLPQNPILLERMRTNTMKNLSKLKKKAPNAERVALIQKHTETLKRIADVISRI